MENKDSDYNALIQQYFSGGSIIDNFKKERLENDELIENNEEIIEPINNLEKENSNIIIGIDLGTTNTCASIWRNNNLEIIPDEYGNRTIPSFVAFTHKSRYIGNDAKNQKELNPKNVFYEVKRLIGRKITDNSVIQDAEFLTYNIGTDDNNNILLSSELGKQYTPEEISAMILTKVKLMACEYLKEDVVKAIITVPAYFNDSQRQATKDAAAIAGLECIRIINEPTSAALAYGLLNRSINKKLVNSQGNNTTTTTNSEGNSSISTVNLEGNNSISTVNLEGNNSITTTNSEGNSSISTVNLEGNNTTTTTPSEGNSSISTVNSEGNSSTTTTNSEGNNTTTTTNSEGNSSISTVNSEGNGSISTINSEGNGTTTTTNSEGNGTTTTTNSEGNGSISTINSEGNSSINVVVYDLGGGTLDVSILNINNGIFEVLSSVGNTHLGGVDFDNRLVGYCISQFKRQHGIEKMNDLNVLSLQKLRRACENTKIILSTSVKSTIAVKNFYSEKDLILSLTRDKYINICKDLLILCIKPVEDALRSSNLERNDIDEIILVGGMTRMPSIRDNIKNFFSGKEPNCTVNPDEVVAAGAAIQGYILSNKDDPFSEKITLLDIIPLSLGVETIGGIMNVLISRNSVIPISKKKLYTTDADYCDSVIVKIFEGERKMTKDNFFVGEFELGDIDPSPRGIPQIEVKFNIDVNGIITVSAENKDKQNKKSITITGNKGRLKPEEIKKLVEESKFYELKDKIEKQKRQSYYEIDDLCSNIIININKSEYKLSELDKKMISEDINEVILWLKEKKYYDRENKEYISVIDKLKKRYGTLILKGNIQDENVKSNLINNDRSNSTTVYGNEDDEDESRELFEQIENEEMGFNKLNENEKLEIKQLRSNLIELCNNIHEIITSDGLNLDDEHKKELRDYIDDILLWVHIHQNPNKNDYKYKIDEINDSCNKMIDEYNNNNKHIFEKNAIVKNINSKKDELEQLCITIKSSIECNIFSLEEEHIKNLDEKVSSTLEWIIESNNNNDAEYIARLEEINLLCDKLYHSMIGISMNKEKTLLGNDRDSTILLNMDDFSGTNLTTHLSK